MQRMSEGGYDTHLRAVAAYSTLGWFLDPVFSTMLRYEEPDLVEIILHEMVHRTIFVKDQAAFNEGLATFVAERATRAFFQSRLPGEGDQVQRRLEERNLDRERFQDIVQALAERLRGLYASSLDDLGKLTEKDRIFEEARQSLKDQAASFHGPGYVRLLDQNWNNAFVASYLTYHQDLDLFEALLERLGGDLRDLVEWAKRLEEEGVKDPYGRIRRDLEPGKSESD
jgi:predicted aminopeptidase